MKKITLILFAFISFVCVTDAQQLYVKEDINKDGIVSISDLANLIDLLAKNNYSKSSESLFVGTWRSKNGDVITLNSDGSAYYGGLKTYKYDPNKNSIHLYDNNSLEVKEFLVFDANNAYLNLKLIGSDENIIYFNSSLYVNSITLNKKSLELDAGAIEILTATALPISALDNRIKWSTSNRSIASVNDKGIVTALNRGTCIISANALDGSGEKAECFVSVNTMKERNSVVSINEIGARISFSNDGEYEWDWDDKYKRLYSTNEWKDYTSSCTTIIINTDKDCEFSFDYETITQDEGDMFSVKLDQNTIIDGVTGRQKGSCSCTLSEGNHLLILTYTKDGYLGDGDDEDFASISNMKFKNL